MMEEWRNLNTLFITRKYFCNKVTLILPKLALMKILLKICFLFFLFISVQAVGQDNISDTKSEKKNEVESAKLKRKKVNH